MIYVILPSMLMILLSTLSVIWHVWQQLEMAAELESNIQDTVDWGKKWLVDFNAGGKTQIILLGQSNITGAIDVKMDGSAIEEKSTFKMRGMTFSSKLN